MLTPAVGQRIDPGNALQAGLQSEAHRDGERHAHRNTHRGQSQAASEDERHDTAIACWPL